MDVVDLKEFYASPLGGVARRLIAHRVRSRHKGFNGATILGLGYALPYLDAWREEAERILGFMPAGLGVTHWPAEGPSATALVDEFDFPLPDGSVDLALIVHGVEMSENLPELLREVWRVLRPSGRALLVVPNRRGMWARFDRTPFGHGRPFSRQQLTEMLREARFSPSGWAHALFVPPFQRSFLVRSAAAWERLGLWLSPAFSGVIIVEAMKQVYAASTAKRARRMVPRLKPGLTPVPAAGRLRASRRLLCFCPAGYI